MLDALRASPSVGSYSAAPFEINEIDAHPDRDRIWATVAALAVSADEHIADAEIDIDKVEEDAADEQLLTDKSALNLWAKGIEKRFLEQFPDQHNQAVAVWFRAQIAIVGGVL
jgi:hypothetical protein